MPRLFGAGIGAAGRELDVPGSPGFLYKLGRLLDTPGRWVRSGLTGMEDATGRDLLYKLGLYKSRYNPPGLDWGDVAGFGAEVVSDPLTYVGGLGVGTKAGKAAARVAESGSRLKGLRIYKASKEFTPERLKFFDDLILQEKGNIIKQVELAKKLGGSPTPLKGWGAQARAATPQRALLQAWIPGHGNVPLIRGAPVLEQLEKVAPLLRKIPGSSTLARVFNDPTSPKTKALREIHAMDEKARQLDVLAKFKHMRETAAPLQDNWAANKDRITEGIEYNPIEARATQARADLLAEAQEKNAELRLTHEGRHVVGQQETAQEYLKREIAKSQGLEQTAAAFARSGIDEKIGRLHADFGDEIEKTYTEYSKAMQDVQLKRALERSEGVIQRAGAVTKLEPAVQISKRLMDMRQGIDRARELFNASLKVATNTKGKDPEYARKLLRMGRARLLKATEGGYGEAIKEARALAAQGSPEGARLEALAQKLWDDSQGWISQQAARIDDIGKTKAASENLEAYKAFNKGPAARAALRFQGQAQNVVQRAIQEAQKIETRPMGPKALHRLHAALIKAYNKYWKKDVKWDLAGKEAVAGMGRVPAGGMPLVKEIEDLYADIRPREIAAHAAAPDSFLRAENVGYTFRAPGPGKRAYMEQFPAAAAAPETRALQVAGPHNKMRVKELLEKTTPEASRILSDLTKSPMVKGKRLPWFEDDPILAATKRATRGEQNIASAHLGRSFVQSFSKPMAEGMMPIKEFVEKSGMKGLEAPAGLGIEARIADEFLAMRKLFNKPEAARKISKAIDFVNGFFRASLTQPFPAFHLRNLISDTMLSMLGKGADLKQIMRAIHLSRDPAWLRRMEELGVTRGAKVRELVQGVNPDAGNPIMDAIYNKVPGLRKGVQKAEPLTSAVENFTRTWHFLSKKAQGLTDMESAAEVRKWLLDYSSMSEIEKNYLRKWVLFYQWPRKVIPLLAKSSVEVPNRFANMVRATTWPSVERPEEGLPEFLRQTAAIPISPNAQGDPRFIAGFGSPLEELNKFDMSSPEGGVFGALGTAARKIGSQLAPTLKVPLETMFGKELYYDRPIILGDKAPEALLAPGLKQLFGAERVDLGGGKSKVRADPYMLYYLQRNMPWARAVQTAGQAADIVGDLDPRTSPGMNILKLLTGIRTPSLDPQDRARTEIEGIRSKLTGLIRQGRAGEKPIFFAREREGVKDPETQALLKRSRTLQKLLKSAREETPGPP